jgi:hypothetical protein
MQKPVKIYTLVFIILIFLVPSASSQVTSSPYSLFGMGTIGGSNIGASMAMGGTGIGFLSDKTINLLNPASYNGFDSLITIFELGIFGKYSSYKTGSSSQSLFDANIKYFAMGFRISPKFATSFGITPYSTIGYTINSTSAIEGSIQEYQKTFSGEGGVNQFYFGNSYAITKNLVLGINAAYLFGTITHSESSESINYTLKDLTYVSNFNFNYGLNYQFILGRGRYNIGLIYDNGKVLRTKNESTISTIYETEVLKSQIHKYRIPQTIGVGLAYEKNFFKVGLDYEFKKWKDIDFNNPFLKTRNSNRYSFGVEIPSLGARKGMNNMIFYRFGAEYNGSYLIIDNIPINYRAISFGAGIPLKGVFSVINLSLELGQNGTKKKGLIEENTCTLHIDFSLKDQWFMKRKYN